MKPESYVFAILCGIVGLLFIVVWAATGNGVRGKLYHLITGLLIGLIAYYVALEFYYLTH